MVLPAPRKPESTVVGSDRLAKFESADVICDLCSYGRNCGAEETAVEARSRLSKTLVQCLRPLLADVGDVQGFPLLNEQLRLGPHPAFIMGRAAMLSLGPAAGNLWGAQRAARLITQAITGVDVAHKTAGWTQTAH